tara:strand:- start:103 stop:219 length:117 start_codon:yes stop_codon:yes gene_type:complete
MAVLDRLDLLLAIDIKLIDDSLINLEVLLDLHAVFLSI